MSHEVQNPEQATGFDGNADTYELFCKLRTTIQEDTNGHVKRNGT